MGSDNISFWLKICKVSESVKGLNSDFSAYYSFRQFPRISEADILSTLDDGIC